MQGDEQDLKGLHTALLKAFPTRPALARMVSFRLKENLETICANTNLEDTAFELIQWAGAHSRMADLVKAVREASPDTPPAAATPPFMAPDLPRGFVPRPA